MSMSRVELIITPRWESIENVTKDSNDRAPSSCSFFLEKRKVETKQLFHLKLMS